MARAPVLTLTILGTVGLGIGATTAIFGAVYAALLRPLPYAEPERLVRIYTEALRLAVRGGHAAADRVRAAHRELERLEERRSRLRRPDARVGVDSTAPAQYGDAALMRTTWGEIERRVGALPGVAGVAFADGRPPGDVDNFNNFDLEDSPTPPGQSQPVTPWVAVTPDYFRVLGLTLVEGRLLEERDGLQPDLESVVVDRAWARRFFPGASALGKRFREGGCTACPWTTVVGVVSEVKYAGLEKPDEGTVYWPLTGSLSRYLVVRTHGSPAAMLPAIEGVVRDVEPGAPLANAATVGDLVARSLDRPGSLSLLVGSLALVALMLSVVGIYGVMTYYVQQHLRDIAIRVALGGSRRAVLRLVVGQGMVIVGLGITAGLGIALVVTRLAASLLFGVGPADVVAFAGVGTLLLIAALAACLVPAARALGVPPAAVLRQD